MSAGRRRGSGVVKADVDHLLLLIFAQSSLNLLFLGIVLLLDLGRFLLQVILIYPVNMKKEKSQNLVSTHLVAQRLICDQIFIMDLVTLL